MIFKSQKRVALMLFRKQLEKINALQRDESMVWKAKTSDLIKLFIKEDSSLLPRLGAYGIFFIDDFNKAKQNAKELVNECIEFIEINGVKRNEKGLLDRIINNKDILSTAVFTTWTIAYFVLNYTITNKVESDKINLESENKQLKSSNITLKDSLSNLELLLNTKNKNLHPQK